MQDARTQGAKTQSGGGGKETRRQRGRSQQDEYRAEPCSVSRSLALTSPSTQQLAQDPPAPRGGLSHAQQLFTPSGGNAFLAARSLRLRKRLGPFRLRTAGLAG